MEINPSLPKACPKITVRNLNYQGVKLDVSVEPYKLKITLLEKPSEPLKVTFKGSPLAIESTGEFETSEDPPCDAKQAI